MFEYLEIIERLKEQLGFKNNTQLSDLFGVSTQTMGNWKSRNKIPYEEILTICLKENLDINFVMTGQKKENKLNFKEENIKMIENLSNEEQKNLYHLLKSKIIKN